MIADCGDNDNADCGGSANNPMSNENKIVGGFPNCVQKVVMKTNDMLLSSFVTNYMLLSSFVTNYMLLSSFLINYMLLNVVTNYMLLSSCDQVYIIK